MEMDDDTVLDRLQRRHTSGLRLRGHDPRLDTHLAQRDLEEVVKVHRDDHPDDSACHQSGHRPVGG